jgi:methylisocitrate lyase
VTEAGAPSAAGLRALLAGGSIIPAPGALEPYTARIIERLGFPAVYLGGNAIGIHLCVGQPFTTMTETVDVALRVMRAVEVPLIVDGGAGFGEPAHVDRTVHECVRAGIAALQLDDQPYPRRAAYHRGRGGLVPLRQAVDRLRAAVAARGHAEMLLIARTDALRATGSADAVIERCHAYADAGADALLVLDLEPDDLRRLAGSLPDLPLAWIGATSGPGPSLAELEEAGFRLALYPFNTVAAVTDAVTRTWEPLLTTGRIGQSSEVILAARQRVLELLEMEHAWGIERETVERGEAWAPAGQGGWDAIR